MEFQEYEKMENSFSRLKVTNEMKKATWIVTEKVHGANFSFHVAAADGESEGAGADTLVVRAARRRAFLKENESFFNHLDGEFMKTCPDKIKKLFRAVVAKYPEKNINAISVWGELFGGTYVIDGKELNTKNIQPVQTEIQYSPNIEWVAYDISYRTKDNDAAKQEYLDYDAVTDLFKQYEIFHLRPLFKGPMNEALNYDLKFDSTIPKILGLPALPKGSNIVEGVVAKPLKNLKCMDSYDEEVRAVVKLKNMMFQEVKPAAPAKTKGKGKAKQEPKLMQKVMAYTTEQRLTNAISKHGFPADAEVEKRVVDEFLADVLVDLKLDEPLYEEWSKATETEKAKTKNVITGKAKGLIKKMKNAR